MGNPVHRAIWYLRTKKGMYISREAERYAVAELEEDLFPYGFDGGADETVLECVCWFIENLNAGKIDISGTYEERTLKRYEALKKDYLHMLWMANQNDTDDNHDDDLPF